MRRIFVFTAMMIMGVCAWAQGITPSIETEALGIYSAKDQAWHSGASESAVVKVAAFGSRDQHILYALGSEVTIPDFKDVSWLGGIRFLPDISTRIGSHTSLPTTITVHFQAEAGNTIDTSSTTSSNHVTQRYGGGVSVPIYDSTSGEFVVHVINGSYLQIGNVKNAEMTAGIAYIFGRNASVETARRRAKGNLARLAHRLAMKGE